MIEVAVTVEHYSSDTGFKCLLSHSFAYEGGRDSKVKDFIAKAYLLEYLKGIGSSRDDFIRFAHYMEALVAYHRFFGGREN